MVHYLTQQRGVHDGVKGTSGPLGLDFLWKSRSLCWQRFPSTQRLHKGQVFLLSGCEPSDSCGAVRGRVCGHLWTETPTTRSRAGLSMRSGAFQCHCADTWESMFALWIKFEAILGSRKWPDFYKYKEHETSQQLVWACAIELSNATALDTLDISWRTCLSHSSSQKSTDNDVQCPFRRTGLELEW